MRYTLGVVCFALVASQVFGFSATKLAAGNPATAFLQTQPPVLATKDPLLVPAGPVLFGPATAFNTDPNAQIASAVALMQAMAFGNLRLNQPTQVVTTPKTPVVVATPPPKVVATPPPKVVATPPPKVVATPPPKVVATPPPKVVATPSPKVVATPPPKVVATPPPKVVATPPPKVVATPPPKTSSSQCQRLGATCVDQSTYSLCMGPGQTPQIGTCAAGTKCLCPFAVSSPCVVPGQEQSTCEAGQAYLQSHP